MQQGPPPPPPPPRHVPEPEKERPTDYMIIMIYNISTKTAQAHQENVKQLDPGSLRKDGTLQVQHTHTHEGHFAQLNVATCHSSRGPFGTDSDVLFFPVPGWAT